MRKLILVAIAAWLLYMVGCTPSKIYNKTPEQYITQVATAEKDGVGVDLAIIEFDEFGMLWDRAQLDDTLRLIKRRNAESTRGISLMTYTHGWMNNADPEDENGDLVEVRNSAKELSKKFHSRGAPFPDHIIQVYLSWRGKSINIPGLSTLSFWARKTAAERVASYQMREALFQLGRTARLNPDSKVMLSGHSMGGMILAQTLSPSLSTGLIANGKRGIRFFADLVVLQNPALDGLSVYQFVEYLKRTGTVAELRYTDGRIEAAPGPIIASITSKADWVTEIAFAAGEMVGNLNNSFRNLSGKGELYSQKKLANNAHGHIGHLISHRAWIENDEIKLERVTDAYNDTPFWIINVSSEISDSHGDIHNPRFAKLIERLIHANGLFDKDVETWITTTKVP